MERIELENLLSNDELLDRTLFHFAKKSSYETYQKLGFNAIIGENAMNIETNPKVFFAEGPLNLLRIADVWIRWTAFHIMKHTYYKDGWSNDKQAVLLNDFAHGVYNEPEFLNETYSQFYNFCKGNDYYVFNLEEGVDFKFDDIDEVKSKNMNNGVLTFSPTFMHMYGPYSDFTNINTDKWNLHTMPGRGVSADKSYLVVSSKYGDDFNMLDMIREVYNKCLSNDKYKEQLSELVSLNGFLSKTHILEEENNMIM